MILVEPSFAMAASITDRLDHAPAHLRAIWLAIRDRDCTYASVLQNSGRFRIPMGRPVICMIGDDLNCAMGPVAFHRQSLQVYLSKCGYVVIVSSSATVEAYSGAAARAATDRQHVAIIETLPEFEHEWLYLVEACAPRASILRSIPYSDLSDAVH